MNIGERWAECSAAERSRLQLAALIIAALLAWLLIWQPMNAKQEQLESRLESRQQTLSWMQGAAQQLQQAGPRAQSVSANGLQAFVGRMAHNKGLKPERLLTLEPGRVQIQFQQVVFTDVMAMNQRITAAGVQLEKLVINRAEKNGQVSAQLSYQVRP